MLNPRHRPPRSSCGAFSLLEVLVTIAVLGILAIVAVESTTRLREGATATKLDSDVAAINQSIKVYLANGGNLDGVTDPAAVLEKLKTRREASDAAAFAGFRSDMIDQRVVPVLQTVAEAAQRTPRAVWNATAKRFDMAQQGAAGVARFELDAAAGRADHGVESREAGAVALNRGDGWIWNYEDAAPPVLSGPGTIPVTTPTPLVPAAPTPPGRLQAPVFSTPGGTYRYNTFPDTVTITNPSGTGQIMVGRSWTADGVQWEAYTGPVTIEPGSHLLAFVQSPGGEYTDSVASSGTYELEIIELEAPRIEPSASLMDLDSNQTVSIQIVNPNPSDYRSYVEYALSDGNYVRYEGPLSISPSSHAAGFEIAARVVPSMRGFEASEPVTRWLPVKLRPPLIDKKQTGAIFDITLFDRNPANVGTLRYLIQDLRTGTRTAWQDYSAAFAIDGSLYGKGFEVVTYAATTSTRHLDSSESSAQGRSFFGTQVADRAILVLDVSGSMASNGRLTSLKAEAKRLLSAMPQDGKISIISFSSKAKLEFAYQTTTSSKITQAQGIIDSLKASGLTNYSESLNMALGIVKANPDVEQVVFLSDGAPTTGDTSTNGILRIVDSIAALKVAVSPIGYQMTTDAERKLIQRMKERGTPTF